MSVPEILLPQLQCTYILFFKKFQLRRFVRSTTALTAATNRTQGHVTVRST